MTKKTPKQFVYEKYALNENNENEDFTIPINSAIGYINEYYRYVSIVDRINLLEKRVSDANNHPRNSFFIGVKISSENEIKELKTKLEKQNEDEK